MFYAIYSREEGAAKIAVSQADSLRAIVVCPNQFVFVYSTDKECVLEIKRAAPHGWHGVKIPVRTITRLTRSRDPYVDCNRRVWDQRATFAGEIVSLFSAMDKTEADALIAEFPGFFGNGPVLTDMELRTVWDTLVPELRILRPRALEAEDLRRQVFVARAIGRGHLDSAILDALLRIRPGDTRESLAAKIVAYVPDARVSALPAVEAVSPRTLFQGLDKTVVGQEDAKRQVSVAVYNHVQNLNSKNKLVAPPKSHVLLLGPSGVGKTLLAHSTGKILSLPFVSTDATGFSPTGFTGGDADACIGDLLVKTHGIVEAAERGIVLIDEVDKLAGSRSGSSSEHLNTSTQGTLLRLIEGKDVKVPSTLFGEPQGAPPIPVNTSRMLFFLGGAFPGLSEIVGKLVGYSGRTMGLRQDAKDDALAEAIKSHEILASADYVTMVQALIDYGMGAELVGRIPTIAALAPLTKDELRKCLIDVPHAEVRLKTALFAESGLTLEFDDALIEKIVDTAYSQATGTRALQALVARVTSRAAFDHLGSGEGYTVQAGRVILTVNTLADPNGYRFEKGHIEKRHAADGKWTTLAGAATSA